ncbi:MAG: TolC family protein [Candidatus Coatesbacteria bacterium]
MIRFTALCLVLATAASAEDALPVLTWEACVAEARAGNSALREAGLGLDAARARRNAAYGGFLPRVNASLGASDSDRNNRLWYRDLNSSWSARLSASQSLFSGFSTLADVLRSSASTRREEAAFRQTAADLRARLRRAFVDVVYGQENVTVQEGIAQRRRANADLVRLKYEAGRENKGSALRAEADALQAAYEVARARRALILSRQKLARELGRDAFTEFRVQPDWTMAPPPPSPDLAAVAEATPAAASAAASVDEAHASLMAARAPFYPALDASASLGRDGADWFPDEGRSWSAGLSVSWSLFNGGRDWFAWRASRAVAAESESSLASVRRDQRVSLQEALFYYVDTHEALAVRDRYLEAARTRAEIGRAQYANGLLGFVQWDLIEGDLVDAERSSIAARRDGLYAEAGWRRALGEGL